MDRQKAKLDTFAPQHFKWFGKLNIRLRRMSVKAMLLF
jgi:hypothetical protein